jgi:phosphoribosylaminoimidazole-succinocarboxamide synthase
MQKKVMSIDKSTTLPPLLYRGSVKNVRGDQASNFVIFQYSDRYSVFDWGEMPDAFAGKGEALAVLTDFLYRKLALPWGNWTPKFSTLCTSPQLPKLQKQGLRHHGLGLVDQAGAAVAEGSTASLWKVEACQRKLPDFNNGAWDYSWYASKECQNFAQPLLVPLEVVFRFGVPEGSSFLKRQNKYKAGDWLATPIVEYFSKLEATDRYLTTEEAQQIAGLSLDEESTLRETALLLACRIKDLFAEHNLTLWDGKFEFAFLPQSDGRSFVLVDAIGPDELRITSKDGMQVSKEILRQYYKSSAWFQAVEAAKKTALLKNDPEWKNYCSLTPDPLPESLCQIIAELYKSLTNKIIGKPVFLQTRELNAVLIVLAEALK